MSALSALTARTNIQELQGQIAELEREVERLEEKRDAGHDVARELEAARAELYEAKRELEEAITKAINELEIYRAEIKATDRAYAQRLRGKLDELRAFNTQLSNIRASFCSENGFTYGGVRKVLSDETRDKAQVKFELGLEWGYVRNILQSPFESIRPEQFAHAAQFFVSLETLTERERFLNAFLEPAQLPSITSNPYGATPLTICSRKIAGVQGFVEGGIGAAIAQQRRFATNSDGYNAIQRGKDHLIQLSALLTVVDSLTGPGPAVSHLGVQQHLILGTGNGNPIRLTGEKDGGVTLTFNHGQLYGYFGQFDSFLTTIRPVSTTGSRHHLNYNLLPPTSSEIVPSSRTISPVFGGYGINRGHDDALLDFFYTRHQFDFSAHIATEFASLTVSVATLGAGPAAAMALEFVKAVPSAVSAWDDSRVVQRDFVRISEGSRYGEFHRDFAFRGVNVTADGQPPQIISWPTADTMAGLAAFNATASNSRVNFVGTPNPNDPSAGVQINFNSGEFAENSTRVFEIYAQFSDADMDYFGIQRRAYVDARRDRVESPDPVPAQNPETISKY